MDEKIVVREYDPKEGPWITPLEFRILQATAEGKTSKETGIQLGISYRTVEVHRYNAMKRLKGKNMPNLIHILHLGEVFSTGDVIVNGNTPS